LCNCSPGGTAEQNQIIAAPDDDGASGRATASLPRRFNLHDKEGAIALLFDYLDCFSSGFAFQHSEATGNQAVATAPFGDSI